MDLYSLIGQTIESQGLIAVMLAYMIYQNTKERAALLHKNCELNQFIMACLKQKIDEDSPVVNGIVDKARASNFNDLPPKGTITPTANKDVI
jgi:hypothetical protein